jgi:hypothetical protein
VATSIEAASLIGQFAPLAMLSDAPAAAAFTPAQLQALATLSTDLSGADYTVYTVFFGLDILLMSYLLLRSGYVPRPIAVLLAVDGLAYLVYSFTNILAPDVAVQLTPWIQLPAPLAEGGLSLWLLAFGVNVRGWTRADSVRTLADD